MNEVQTKQITISSLEIAEMLEIKHADLLKKLEGTKNSDGTVKQIGIIPVLGKGNFPVTDYFIKGTYLTAQNKEMPCYKFTKLGCDFIANKFMGNILKSKEGQQSWWNRLLRHSRYECFSI